MFGKKRASTGSTGTGAASANSAPQKWTADHSRDLQKAVDRIFKDAGNRLAGLDFSFTIADPSIPDCPLIGCSEGFARLVGYEMQEIVGRNCRFLVDPVPTELMNENIRCVAREFCVAVANGTDYRVPQNRREPWMPEARPQDDGVFCLQTNARKDGTLFRNMFYMKSIELDEHAYIIGLQTEVGAEADYAVYHEACRLLDINMGEVERACAPFFWTAAGLRRQEGPDEDDGFELAAPRVYDGGTKIPRPVGLKKPWTEEQGFKLQMAIDRVFGVAGDRLKGLRFSLTLADPHLEECPLIGCSTGFGDLCGYDMHEIVGRNCRFLVEPVPEELINAKVRQISREFCASVREGRDFTVSEADIQPWMPKARSRDDGVFCAQTNARKDGTLFENMFYMKRIELDERPYIAGLQTELPRGSLHGDLGDKEQHSLEACHEACRLLDENFAAVERVLAGMFWYTSPMRRQEDPDHNDGFGRLTSPTSPASPAGEARVSNGKGPVAKVPSAQTAPSPKGGPPLLEGPSGNGNGNGHAATAVVPTRPPVEQVGRPKGFFGWLCCVGGATTVHPHSDSGDARVVAMGDAPSLQGRN